MPAAKYWYFGILCDQLFNTLPWLPRSSEQLENRRCKLEVVGERDGGGMWIEWTLGRVDQRVSLAAALAATKPHLQKHAQPDVEAKLVMTPESLDWKSHCAGPGQGSQRCIQPIARPRAGPPGMDHMSRHKRLEGTFREGRTFCSVDSICYRKSGSITCKTAQITSRSRRH